ncbi:uncharacterized protein UDID_18920 [Ustilago sp. UG-2017a]|nr:uncharacterized protein UDID_18920 [Ustilago sp. UG-2017a]
MVTICMLLELGPLLGGPPASRAFRPMTDGTHIPLAWKPGVLSREHFCYKGFHSINVVLVILPHSLQIVKSVVGQPGSIQDSKVWASGSNILKKPRLYLDKVRVQVEHAIAYLKNRFQCLTGYCGNIYHVKDRITTAEMIQACIVAHTFVSRYDCLADIADLLLPSFSEDEGRSTGTKARKKTAIAGLGMVEQEARGLAGTGSRRGGRATSMEKCSLHGDHGHGGLAHMQGGPSTKGDQAQGACRLLPLRGSRDKSQRNHHRSKEEEQCIGDRQAGPEEEEQCRGGTGVPSKQGSKEEEQCRRSRHSSGGQEWC